MKPFNLDEALKGEPVLLKNGDKGYVKFLVPDICSENTLTEFVGYGISFDDEFYVCEWDGEGNDRLYDEYSIVGMWCKEKNMRGMLTDEIKSKSIHLLGYEINQKELRLMPYLQYCVINDMDIERRRINSEEREILINWEKLGFINSPLSDLKIKKSFYDAICELIFIGYVFSVDREG